ncbi:unnamed protein product, partial [marine sediment metagenome]
TDSANGEITIDTWQLVLATFDGAGNCVLYKNGVDVTDAAAGTHAPVADAVENLYFSCLQNGTGPVTLHNYMSGGVWDYRIWNRCYTPGDAMNLFELERHWFNA